MTLDANTELISRQIEAVWNTGDVTAIVDYWSPALQAWARQTQSMLRTGFPDFHITVEDLIAEHDQAEAAATPAVTRVSRSAVYGEADEPLVLGNRRTDEARTTMQTERSVTNGDQHAVPWWRRGPRWIVALVTAIGPRYLGWGGVSFEQPLEPLRNAELAEIVTAARRCITKRG